MNGTQCEEYRGNRDRGAQSHEGLRGQQPRADGGLGLGTVVTSALFLTAILAVVVFLTITRRDETPARTVAPEELQPHLHLPHPHVHVPDVHLPNVAPPRPARDEG